MTGSEDLIAKVEDIIREMKAAGYWRLEAPTWVMDYRSSTQQGFLEWLQFIYLPNLLPQAGNRHILHAKNYIAPQAVRFFGDDIKKGKMLQLLVELDALI